MNEQTHTIEPVLFKCQPNIISSSLREACRHYPQGKETEAQASKGHQNAELSALRSPALLPTCRTANIIIPAWWCSHFQLDFQAPLQDCLLGSCLYFNFR